MRLAKYSGSVPHSACCQPRADLYSRSGYSPRCGLEINDERNREQLIWEEWREKSGSQSVHKYCFQPPGCSRSLVPFDSLRFSVISNTQVPLPSIEYWGTESQDIWERRSVWVPCFTVFSLWVKNENLQGCFRIDPGALKVRRYSSSDA